MNPMDDSNEADDPFGHTRMTFGEHLEDLRRHLLWALVWFAAAFVVSFYPGYYVLEFIKAPVRRQLEEFYARRAREALEDPAGTPELRAANRPQFVRMSFLPNGIRGAGNGKGTPEALPDLPADKEALPYSDLFERAQLLTADALGALNESNWQRLEESADRLKQVAARLGKATQVPAGEQEELVALAGRLGEESALLREQAKRNDGERSGQSLQKIQDLLGQRGLVSMWVRVEEPVRFFAQFQSALMQVYRRPDLSALSVQEAFMAYFKVCFLCGLIIGSPGIFWQIWMFVAAGLYPSEKRLVNVYLPISLGLFLAGVLVCQFIVIPKAISALLWFNEWLRLEPELRFNEWLSFAIVMPLLFGLSFQLPLVMMFLERIGVFTIESYTSRWRIAVFLVHVFAAVIVPSMDIFSMEGLALPLCLLYGLGILLCKLNPHEPDSVDDVPGPRQMVEV
jgi:sec-independent protein translocase protein TatC